MQHGLVGIKSPKITVCYGGSNRESADALFVGLRDFQIDCSDRLQDWDALSGVETSQVDAETNLADLCKDAGIQLFGFLFDLIYDFQLTNVYCLVCGEHTLQILSYLLFQDVSVDSRGVFKIQICDIAKDDFQVRITYDGDRLWDAEFSVTIPKSPGHLLAHLFRLNMSRASELYVGHPCANPLVRALHDAQSVA